MALPAKCTFLIVVSVVACACGQDEAEFGDLGEVDALLGRFFGHSRPDMAVSTNECDFGLSSCSSSYCRFVQMDSEDDEYADVLAEVCDGSAVRAVPREEISANATVLKINSTSIKVLKEGDFEAGEELRILVVEDNPIYLVRSGAFRGLDGLEYLRLRNNRIRVLDWNAFESLVSLQYLILDNNQLNLTKILGGKWDNNASSDFSYNLDPILPSLTFLSLKGNPLTRIEASFFTPLSESDELTEIVLHSCDLRYIHEDAFLPLANLETLSLYNNFKLFSLGQKLDFRGLPRAGGGLLDLDLGTNQLIHIPKRLLREFNGSLESLALSNNVFIELGMADDAHGIDTFPPMPNLRSLNLDACKIQTIHDQVFVNLRNLEVLSLKGNVLFSLPDAVANVPGLSEVYLEGVPDMFLDGQKFSMSDHSSHFHTMSSLRILSITKTPLAPITDKTFKGLKNLTSLILDECSLETIQSGSLKPLEKLEVLSLAGVTGLEGLPPDVLSGPTTLEVVDLSNIQILPYDKSTVLSRNREKGKDVSAALSSDTKDDTNGEDFYVLGGTKVLNLTGSLINLDDPMEYLALSEMPFLEILNMSENRLTGWKTRQFSDLRYLQTLVITNNHDYINLTDAMVDDFHNLSVLDLTRNDFICNSGAIEFFKMAVLTAGALEIVGWYDGEGYECRDTEGGRMTFTKYATSGYDVETGEPPVHDSPDPVDYLAVIAPAVAVIVVVPILGYVAYTNRWYIQYRAAKFKLERENKRKRREGGNPDRFAYDAFVSFNEADSDLVRERIVPELESAGHRLCLHYRDFRPGLTIFENIVSCLEASRTCVVVLSSDYARSQWCQFEAQMALQIFTEDKRNKTILVVVRNRLPALHVTRSLRSVIKLRTYLEWNDPPPGKLPDPRAARSFAKRLRLAMEVMAEASSASSSLTSSREDVVLESHDF